MLMGWAAHLNSIRIVEVAEASEIQAVAMRLFASIRRKNAVLAHTAARCGSNVSVQYLAPNRS